MTDTENAPILVLGATGTTGRRVASLLADAGHPVRARSRATGFDWTQPSTWDAALVGTRAAFVLYSPDLVVPGAADIVEAFAIRARALGVERLVLLSGRGEEAAAEAERRMRAAVPTLTALRCAWFAQNVTEGAFAPMVAEGRLALPVGGCPEPFVDCDDIAAVAVSALTDGAHAGCSYELTGPRALTFAELAEAAGASFVSLTLDEARAGWVEAGRPSDAVWLLSELFGTLFDGRNAAVSDDVARVLGRPARDVVELLTGAPA